MPAYSCSCKNVWKLSQFQKREKTVFDAIYAKNFNSWFETAGKWKLLHKLTRCFVKICVHNNITTYAYVIVPKNLANFSRMRNRSRQKFGCCCRRNCWKEIAARIGPIKNIFHCKSSVHKVLLVCWGGRHSSMVVVCDYQYAAMGSNPKHTIYAFFNLYWNCNEKRMQINKKRPGLAHLKKYYLSSGHGKRLMFWRLRVRFAAPNTGYFTFIWCKNCNVCLKWWN